MLRSATSWDPQEKRCIPSVPVFQTQPTLYTMPGSDFVGNKCLATPDVGLTPTSVANGAVYMADDPALNLKTWYPCPKEVYDACHGDSPIAPPTPGGTDTFCSYNAFSGTNALGGLNLSRAMCQMNLVNVNFEENKDVPFCVSYT
jgi:hypothetical protein